MSTFEVMYCPGSVYPSLLFLIEACMVILCHVMLSRCFRWSIASRNSMEIVTAPSHQTIKVFSLQLFELNGSGPIPTNYMWQSFGVQTEDTLSNSVFWFSVPRKTNTMLPKPQCSTPIFGHSAGPTELDRPHRQQF